jgi:phosphatidylserine/phosphatidylglycerophosphate/cardiolipin synthase-like enzyme
MKLLTVGTSLLFFAAAAHADLAARYEKDTQNPLHKYMVTRTGVGTKTKFVIDYNTLVEYYQYSQPLLTPTLADRPIFDKSYNKISSTMDDIEFHVNLNKNTITPKLKDAKPYEKSNIAPEYTQGLFQFNYDRFIQENGADNLVDAKNNFFNSLSFDDESQLYYRTYLHLNDWKSLIHPPVVDMGDNERKYFKHSTKEETSSKMLTADFNRDMDELSMSKLTKGNKLDILVNRDAYIEKMKLVKEAKESILVSVMSFASDRSSFDLVDEMIKKQQEGVDVKVIIEKLWTKLVFKKTLKRLRAGGIKVLLANDMYFKFGDKQGLFHNKFWIFDNKVAIVGGQNIVNSANISTGFNHWNKDTDVRIEGPMVADVLTEFTTLWKKYDRKIINPTKAALTNANVGRDISQYEKIAEELKAEQIQKRVRGQDNYQDWFANMDSAMDGVCRFIIQGPQKSKDLLSKAYIAHFDEALQHVYFTSQHIEYDTELSEKATWETRIFESLFNLEKKNVRVDLIANGIDGGFAEIGQNISEGKKSEKRERKLEKKFSRQLRKGQDPHTFMSNLSTWLGLKATKKYGKYLYDFEKRNNFHAWMHFQYLHSKTVLIDNIMASIGSFNFEPYSAEKSHESAIFCFDRKLVKQLRTDNIRDIVNSTPVIPGK